MNYSFVVNHTVPYQHRYRDQEYDSVDLHKPTNERATASDRINISADLDSPVYLNSAKISSDPPSSAIFDFNILSPEQANHKSPKPAPRRTKDKQLTAAACASYENISTVLAECQSGGVIVTPPRRCSGYSSSGSRESSEADLFSAQTDTAKSVQPIPDDLTLLTVAGLCDCLLLFELPHVASKFRQHQIDGQFFKIMSDYMFKDENFGFSDFEILKLKKLREGWRPRL